MNTSDKITIVVGTVSLATMFVTGWMGERLCDRILAKVQPKQPPEEKAHSKSKRRRRLRPEFWVGMLEGAVFLGLAWHSHTPVTLGTVLDVCLGISIISLSIVGIFIHGIMDLLRDMSRLEERHLEFTGGIIDILASKDGYRVENFEDEGE